MIHIEWDNSLPPTPDPNRTAEQKELDHWDVWFSTVGLGKKWEVVKEQSPNNIRRQLVWARIMELNRLSVIVISPSWIRLDMEVGHGVDDYGSAS